MAVPSDNSTGNTLNAYFHQIQQKIHIDFSQYATLFCTEVTSVSRAIISNTHMGKKVCGFLGSTQKVDLEASDYQCFHS